MKRYAAKLLFQYRVVVGGQSNKRRTCEERILVLQAVTARPAFSQAKRRGRSAEYDAQNSDGNPVHFEFVGVQDLLELGSECDADEVWYNISTRLMPAERRERWIPPESELAAIRHEIHTS